MPTKLNMTLSNDDTSAISLKSPPVPPSTTGVPFNPPVMVSTSGTCINGIYATSDLVYPLKPSTRCDLTKPINFKVKLATDYKGEQFAPVAPGGTTPAPGAVCFYVTPASGALPQCLAVTGLAYKPITGGGVKMNVVTGTVNLTDSQGNLLNNLNYAIRFQEGPTANGPWTDAVFDPKVLNKPPEYYTGITFLKLVELHALEAAGIGLVVALLGVFLGRATKG